MAKTVITGDLKQKEPKLTRQVKGSNLSMSEVDVIQTLNSTEKEEKKQACLDDLAYVERKYQERLKEPQWQTPEGMEKLTRMYQRFKERRYDILTSLGVNKEDLEVRIN